MITSNKPLLAIDKRKEGKFGKGSHPSFSPLSPG
jgi:hypothetical protein